MRAIYHSLFIGAAISSLVAGTPCLAQTSEPMSFDLPEQPLAEALHAVARQAGLEFSAPAEPLRGKVSKPLKGHFAAAEAARRLLTGTKLVAEVVDGALIVRSPVVSDKLAEPGNGADIIVTGSHIKAAETASPTIRMNVADIEMAGQTNLGEAMRSLPQNFSGGQNPGVMPGAVGSSNVNSTSGSSVNLRGLGADATLTLLNGHRLSYGSSIQAVDISAIPLAAVERVEVVPDGASAIYGTDAVGGVVNVILKSGYNGASVSATIGGATAGGDFQQQYSAVVGKTWNSGTILAAYSHSWNSAIWAYDRNYTRYMPAANTLYPDMSQDSGLVSIKKSLGNHVDFTLDGTYNHRSSFRSQQTTTGYTYQNTPSVISYSLAPSLNVDLSSGWALHMTGTYARDITHFDQATIYQGSLTGHGRGCNCNDLASIEAYTSGHLLTLNGNPVNFVLGGGYRYDAYKSYRLGAANLDANGSVDSYYTFSELSVPIFTPAQGIPFLYKLVVNAALRYERYPGIASVAIPKFGLTYGLADWIDIKGTWGKSFKAPMLAYQYAASYGYLYSAATFGGARFPTGSTMLFNTGGSTDLKPERATSWSATLDLHPRSIKKLNIQLSYFNVDYTDRVIQPVSGASTYQALSNPIYDQFVQYYPSSTDINNAVSKELQLYNYVGTGALNNVIAIFNDQYINAARQRIEGVDLSVDYKIKTGDASSLLLNAAGSWLWSRQKLSSTAPYVELAGTIFNPPRFKARGNIGWTNANFTAMAYINHIGGLIDNRAATPIGIAPQTTFDTSLHYKLPGNRGLLSNASVQLNVQNISDLNPPYAAPSAGIGYYVNYDSTNFSAIGRTISFTITKDW